MPKNSTQWVFWENISTTSTETFTVVLIRPDCVYGRTGYHLYFTWDNLSDYFHLNHLLWFIRNYFLFLLFCIEKQWVFYFICKLFYSIRKLFYFYWDFMHSCVILWDLVWKLLQDIYLENTCLEVVSYKP